MGDGEFAVGEIDEHVVVAQDGGGEIDFRGHARNHHRRGADGLERDFYFFDICEGDLHVAGLGVAQRDRGGRWGGAGFVVTGDVESHERGGPARHGEIGIAVVDPSADAFGGAVGEREIDVDDYAVVIERDGDGDGFGGLRRGFWGFLGEGGGDQG